MNRTERPIETYLLPFNDEISSLAQQSRNHIKMVTKPTTELVGDSMISLNIRYGFTMVIFVVGLAFTDDMKFIDSAKIGILIGSLVSAFIGFTILRLKAKKLH